MDFRFDILLDDKGYILANGGIAESGQQANPYAAKIALGPTDYSDQDIWATIAQTTWDRGRGEVVFEDEGRFSDAFQIDTRIRQQFILGPLKHYSNSGNGIEYPPMGTQEDIDSDVAITGFHSYNLGKKTEDGKVFMGIAQQIEATRTLTGGTCGYTNSTKTLVDESAFFLREDVEATSATKTGDTIIMTYGGGTVLDSTIASITNNTTLVTTAAAGDNYTGAAYKIGLNVTSLSVFMRKHGAPDQIITMRVETDNAGAPSGTLVHANASATISPTDVSSRYAYVTKTFTEFSLKPATAYWLIIRCDTAKASITDAGWYQVGYNWHKGTAANNPYDPPTAAIVGYMYRTVGDTVTWPTTGGTKASMFFRINEGGAVRGDVKWITEYKPTVSANSFLFCGTYDSVNSKGHVYWWDGTNKKWVETIPTTYATATGWAGNVQDFAIFDGKLFVAQGGSNDIYYLDGETAVSNDTWTVPGATWTSAGTGVQATNLCIHGGVLWRSDNSNQIWYTSGPGETPALADWSPLFPDYKAVGTATGGRITNMVSSGQVLYIGKEEGLWAINSNIPGDAYEVIMVMDWRALKSADNFKAMAVWNGNLFFNVKHALYEFATSGVWTNVGPTNDAGLPNAERGKPVSILTTPAYMYVAIDAGSSGRSSLLCYNSKGWHHIVEGDKLGDRILSLGYNYDDDPDRLWYSEGGKIRYINMPEQSDNPYVYTDMHYANHGWLVTSKIDAKMAALDKEWFTVRVDSDNIQAESRLCFGYVGVECTSTTLTDSAPVINGNTTSTFADVVMPGDIVKDIDDNEYYVTAIDSPTEHTLTLSPALASGNWGDAENQYYEIHASSLSGRGTSTGNARWCEVEYRIDSEDDDHWTYLGLVDDSPTKELEFPKTTNIPDVGFALPSMSALGRGHTKNKLWIPIGATGVTTLTPLHDWLYINGEYRQIVGADSTAQSNYYLVTFAVPLTVRPSSGDMVYPGIPWGKFIQLRFNLFSNNKNNTPRIRAWTLKYLADIRDKKLFQLTIENAHHLPLRHGPDDTRTMQEVFDELNTINTKGRCELETLYGTWTVRPVDWRWSSIKKEQVGEAWMVKQYHYLTLVEV